MRKHSKKQLRLLFYLVAVAIAVYIFPQLHLDGVRNSDASSDYTLIMPADRYPETARHIKEAIEAGESPVCTIDRAKADERRGESLKGYPTRQGYDRDEWPMAMCKEGGAGADIRYISPSDNRGAGSWVSHQLEKYPDGTRVKFIME
ncbi:NucA/NucB deoxyribonuclease domain-containing protein [Paenibacillus sp. y28]|uniref:NucA/NucB deoxyribonuclease domain-containing protein n=1 Tax=Paenibacillus sp. y28 TaxID=3129110 RepID=UPI0030190841